jgi:hypothetical protein
VNEAKIKNLVNHFPQQVANHIFQILKEKMGNPEV